MGNSRKTSSVKQIRGVVESFLDRYREPQLPLIVAFSGGLDSSVLLDLAAGYCCSRAVPLSVIHFNHGLSPYADDWEAHCQKVCDLNRVSLETRRLIIPTATGEGIEAAARRERYAVLNALPASHILLGHHADDQAETLLLNLFRGCGILGASGMQSVNGRYFRPLLDLDRLALMKYADERELTWIEDESNADPRYMRNFLRTQVFPLLQQRFPSVAVKLAATTQRFAQTQQLLIELAEIDGNGTSLEFPFPVTALRRLNQDRAANLLRTLLSRACLQCPPAVRLREFVRQVQEAKLDRHPELRVGDRRIHYRKGYLFNDELDFVSEKLR